MTDPKGVLVVGLHPAPMDFSNPGCSPGMSTAKVRAGFKSSEGECTLLGNGVQNYLTDFGDAAEGKRERDCRRRGDGFQRA